MRRLFFLATALICLALASCFLFPTITGSGQLVQKSFQYQGFIRVEAEQTFAVTVKYGTTTSITVTVDDNVVPYLQVIQEGDKLRIGLTSGYNYFNCTLQAVVTMPMISEFSLTGASTGNLENGFPALTGFTTNVSGASSLSATGLLTGSLTCSISGASNTTITGTAATMYINCSGASTANTLGCPAQVATIDESGASTVSAAITSGGSLSYGLSGASRLNYKGSAVTLIQRENSGASSIHQVF